MSALFSPMKIGEVELSNRFINSATYEAMANETGEVSDELIKRYERLAKGGVGLCISGMMYVHASGRGYKNQTGIHDDRRIPGLRKLVDAVHQAGGKIAFQIAHCGRQTTKRMIGQIPLAPASRGSQPDKFRKAQRND